MFSSLSAAELAVVIISIFVAMATHEAAHAFVSHWLGDTTARDQGRLSLNPLRHIDLSTTVLLPIILIILQQPPIFAAKPVPFNPLRVRYREYGIALVALAGPCTNLLLAFLASLLIRAMHLADGSGSQMLDTLYLFMQINVGFFIFNMIPFPPLDGSRLLYAVAPDSLREIMDRIESLDFVVILAFMFIAFRFVSPLIGNIENSVLNLLLR